MISTHNYYWSLIVLNDKIVRLSKKLTCICILDATYTHCYFACITMNRLIV